MCARGRAPWKRPSGSARGPAPTATPGSELALARRADGLPVSVRLRDTVIAVRVGRLERVAARLGALRELQAVVGGAVGVELDARRGRSCACRAASESWTRPASLAVSSTGIDLARARALRGASRSSDGGSSGRRRRRRRRRRAAAGRRRGRPAARRGGGRPAAASAGGVVVPPPAAVDRDRPLRRRRVAGRVGDASAPARRCPAACRCA